MSVGFGSDFDGAEVPRGIGDASGLPRLLAALRARGYDDAALKRLAHENWIRVLTGWAPGDRRPFIIRAVQRIGTRDRRTGRGYPPVW